MDQVLTSRVGRKKRMFRLKPSLWRHTLFLGEVGVQASKREEKRNGAVVFVHRLRKIQKLKSHLTVEGRYLVVEGRALTSIITIYLKSKGTRVPCLYGLVRCCQGIDRMYIIL